MRKNHFLLVFLIVFLTLSFLFIPIALAADTTNYVDNNTSNIDSHVGHGTESSFAAEQSAPDSSFDTITEADTDSTSSITTVFSDGFEAGNYNLWTDGGATSWSDGSGTPGTNSTYGTPWLTHSGTYMAEADNNDDGSLTTDFINMADATQIGVMFWYMDDDLDSGTDFTLSYYNGSAYNVIADIQSATEDTWLRYSANITDAQYFLATFRIRFTASTGTGEVCFVDDVSVNKTAPVNNFELDLERQWTTADYDETNEELCIYTGTMNAENLDVQVWDGEEWQLVIDNLVATSWNNASVVGYLTSATLTMRFIGGTEVADATQSSWQIDSVLLHTWTPSTNYVSELSLSTSSTWTTSLAWTTSASLSQSVTTTWNLLTQSTFNIAPSLSLTFSWLLEIIQATGPVAYIADFALSISTNWNMLAQWVANANFIQQLTTSWSIVVQWIANANLEQSITSSWSILVASAFSISNSFSLTFSWIVDSLLNHVSNLIIADLSLSLTTSWSVLTAWTANLDITQSMTLTWNVLIKSVFNTQLSLATTFTWIIDLVYTAAYVPVAYVAELTLSLSTSWVINLIQGLQYDVALSVDIVTTWAFDFLHSVLPPLTAEEVLGVAIGLIIIFFSTSIGVAMYFRKKDNN